MEKERIIKSLSLEEKVKFLMGGKTFETLGDEDLGIPVLSTIDGHNGVNLMQKIMDYVPIVLGRLKDVDIAPSEFMGLFFEIGEILGGITGMAKLFQDDVSEEAYGKMSSKARELAKGFSAAVPSVMPGGHLPTAFPAGLSMASTWDTKLMQLCGEYVGKEALAFGGDILLAPNINIQRDPHCGRMFESFSEDPFLNAQMVIPYIKGVQGTGMLANVKHFVANNQETNRHTVDEIISERALREIYLPGFKAAVQKADCKTVMTAYNYVNGVACSAHETLLQDILRDEWGFDGLVLSDWNAVYDQVAALKAGNDLEMPGPKSQEAILKAVEQGALDEAVIDRALARFLKMVEESPSYREVERPVFDVVEHQAFARKMASDSMILLKNEETLPLSDDMKVGVYGKNAIDPIPCGTGSAGVVSKYVISGLEGLKAYYEVSYVDKIAVANNDAAIVFIGEVSGEGSDRASIKIDEEQSQMIREVSKAYRKKDKKVIGILNVAGPLALGELDGCFDAILVVWYPGQEIGRAIADVISGRVNPSGKLTCSMPMRKQDLATYPHFPGAFGKAVYGEDIFVGYRNYEMKKIKPQYAFGHGLSYSEFIYSNLIIENTYEENRIVTVSVDVENTSDCFGKEVVQLYVADLESTLVRPRKELKGFEKIELEPGQKKCVTFALDQEAFQMYDVRLKNWVVEPGEFEISVGSASDKQNMKKAIMIVCETPYPLTLKRPLTDFFAREDAMAVINKFLPPQLMTLPEMQIEQIFHPDLTLDEAMDKHMFKHLKMSGEKYQEFKAGLEADLMRI